MFESLKRGRIQKKLNKCRIELGGVQAEINVIDKICTRYGKISNGQVDRLQILGRKVGELQTEIAIHEQELARHNWVNATQAADDN